MKKVYEQPIAQDIAMEMDNKILGNTSNIGEGGEGQEGDVNENKYWDVPKEVSPFHENTFTE